MSDYYRVSLLDSTGSWWDGDAGVMTDSEIESFDEACKAIFQSDAINVLIGGVEHYFNPVHIVAIKLGVAAGPPPGLGAS